MIKNLLRSLGLGRSATEPKTRDAQQSEFPALRSAEVLAILGDVHGMVRPFERMLARLEREAPDAKVVCVGDLIDRGDESAQVLRMAYAARHDMVVLMGNHEEMMLRFLENPAKDAQRWFRNGGLQALASFAIAPPRSSAGPQEHEQVRDRLRAALTPEIEAWLRQLPRCYQSGNLLVTHAGADPWLPVALQPAQALTWGHPDFTRRRRTDGMWVAYGHVIVPEPLCENGMIAVDTGAFAGGALTASVVRGGSVVFLSEAC